MSNGCINNGRKTENKGIERIFGNVERYKGQILYVSRKDAKFSRTDKNNRKEDKQGELI